MIKSQNVTQSNFLNFFIVVYVLLFHTIMKIGAYFLTFYGSCALQCCNKTIPCILIIKSIYSTR